MLRSEYIIAAALFLFGIVFIISSPSITGAVTGNSSGGSIWFSLVGLLFIITASLLLVSAKYRVQDPDFDSDHSDAFPDYEDDSFEHDIDLDSEIEPKPRKD
jgi:hypothetical protein